MCLCLCLCPLGLSGKELFQSQGAERCACAAAASPHFLLLFFLLPLLPSCNVSTASSRGGVGKRVESSCAEAKELEAASMLLQLLPTPVPLPPSARPQHTILHLGCAGVGEVAVVQAQLPAAWVQMGHSSNSAILHIQNKDIITRSIYNIRLLRRCKGPKI